MTPSFAPYQRLRQRFHDVAILNSATQLLSWDQETFMPPRGIDWRAVQLGRLGGMAHRLATPKIVGDWLSRCEDHAFAPDSDEAANVREWRRDYERATRVPARLVERLERTGALSREAWLNARAQADFRLFKPHLRKLVDLQLQLADCWGYDASPYDALLEEYEPGARSGPLGKLFDRLCPELVNLLATAKQHTPPAPPDLLDAHYPIAAQQAFNRRVVEAMGFDLEAGRIDTAAHPFCSGLGPRDCRLTTRYDERNFTQSLYGVLHEAGHGLYDQGLRAEHFGEPVGTACSLGIHESQSRLWENHVGRSRTFWEHWHPVACEYFPDLARRTPGELTAAVNRVQPSFIRVEADEVTYDLHVALRFDIERRLIERQLQPDDVPAAWNEQFEARLGLKVDNDSNGCLQDIHWSLGHFGYFPTYTLGNLNASQLMAQARREIPEVENQLAGGRYGPLLDWLRDRIHRPGRRHSGGQLIERATGEPTSPTHLLEHLRVRFCPAG